MNSLKLNVELNELHRLRDFIHGICPKNIQIDLIVEEIFVNIISYSNADYTIVNADLNETLTIEFIDNGIEFNPILKEPPKPSTSIEDVEIGGRGIILVKRFSDDLIYRYVNGENHLKVIKNVEQ